MKKLNETAHKILDIAEEKTQTVGFNAFSYKDIQAEIGIKTSSIHYYFPTKHDLALALTGRYIEKFRENLKNIEKKHKSGTRRIKALGSVYKSLIIQEKFCMCGMLASDLLSLPEQVNIKLQEFFTINEIWIENALQLAQEQNEIQHKTNLKNTSLIFFAALQGGILIARSKKDSNYLESIISQFIKQLKG